MATIVRTVDTRRAMVTLSLTFSTAVTAVRVVRYDAVGTPTTLRAGDSFPLTNGTGLIYDHEVPLDVPVSYTATQVAPAGSEAASTALMTVISEGRTWLKDPGTPSRNQVLAEVTGLGTMTYQSQAGVFPIIDRRRPIVVASTRHDWAGELSFSTATAAERDGMHELLSRGQVLLLSTPAGYGIGNVYVHAGDVSVTRVGLVTSTTRRWVVPLTVVDRPATLSATPLKIRWGDVKNGYANWDAVYALNETWDQFMDRTSVT
jgi:hypothetical protein